MFTFGVTIDRSRIRVKAMLIAPNSAVTAHAVSLNAPTSENPHGYHRLIGGSVELGESHRDAIVREVDEELGAKTAISRSSRRSRASSASTARSGTRSCSSTPEGWTHSLR